MCIRDRHLLVRPDAAEPGPEDPASGGGADRRRPADRGHDLRGLLRRELPRTLPKLPAPPRDVYKRQRHRDAAGRPFRPGHCGAARPGPQPLESLSLIHI